MAAPTPVSVLLDTCAVLALARGELPAGATASLRSAPEAVVSVVSAWEVGIKTARGKLRLTRPPLQWFAELTDRYALRVQPLDAGTAFAAAALPPVHRDPFDRVLVALAQAQTLVVLTSDEHIPKYPGIHAVW